VQPVPLVYQQAHLPRWRQWPRWPWVCAAIIAAAWIAHETLWPRWRHWQREHERSLGEQQWYRSVAQHVDPPTKLKYSEDPADAPPGGFTDSYCTDDSAAQSQGFVCFGGTQADYCVRHLTGWSPVCGVREMVNLFTHERTTSSGVTRLVVVGIPRFHNGKLSLSWQQIAVRGGFCRDLNSDSIELDMTGICGPGEIRLYAGQPDPAVASKFSIPFAARGRSGCIDGVFVEQPARSFFGEPGDPESAYVVKAWVRQPPATPPQRSSLHVRG